MAETATLPVKRPRGRPPVDRKIDVGKALKHRLNGNSFADIGTLLCREQPFSKQAVEQALKPFELFLNNPETVTAYRDNKANLLESAELVLLSDLLDDEKRKKASLNNVAYSMSQISNQLRLERGPSGQPLAVPPAIMQALQVSLKLQVNVNGTEAKIIESVPVDKQPLCDSLSITEETRD